MKLKFILKNQYLVFQIHGYKKNSRKAEAPFPRTVPNTVNTDFETGCLGLEVLLPRHP